MKEIKVLVEAEEGHGLGRTVPVQTFSCPRRHWLHSPCTGVHCCVASGRLGQPPQALSRTNPSHALPVMRSEYKSSFGCGQAACTRATTTCTLTTQLEMQEMPVRNQVALEVPIVEPGATCDCAHTPSVVEAESTHKVVPAPEQMRSVFISTKLMSEFLHYAKVGPHVDSRHALSLSVWIT
jgi:hypothetical protein